MWIKARLSENLPEITIKSVIISIILAGTLAAANAFLGMKVGLVISPSIPAAIIAMGVLRFFKQHNVLEINIVQTGASASEAVAAVGVFTFPALLIVNFWDSFHPLMIISILIVGGLIGVFFSVLLRRVLFSDKTLVFPEGVAIGNVLRVSTNKAMGLKHLALSGVIGASIDFLRSGLQIVGENVAYWFKLKGTMMMGFSVGISPALIGAGYIVGANVGLAFLIGIIIAWGIALPILSAQYGLVDLQHLGVSAGFIWGHYIRYIGVGTFLVAGIWTILKLLAPMKEGIRLSLESMQIYKQNAMAIPREERDIPIHYAGWGMLILILPLLMLIMLIIDPIKLGITQPLFVAIVFVSLIVVLVLGFMTASVAGYFAGLLGSTNNPLSSLMIAGAIVVGFCLTILFRTQIHFEYHPQLILEASGLIVLLLATILATAAVTNDTIQDLKAGQMVGATPWKQQVMMIIGVVVAALVTPFILQLLFNAYGIGGVFPRPDMDPSKMLAAPQATILSVIAKSALGGHGVPWNLLAVGAGIGVFFIILDEYLRKTGRRLSVLAIGSGIYLPMDTILPLMIGALLSYFVNRKIKQLTGEDSALEETIKNQIMLLTCGLVGGASIMGVILAIPFAAFKSTDVLKIMPDHLHGLATGLAVMVMVSLVLWIYHSPSRKAFRKL